MWREDDLRKNPKDDFSKIFGIFYRNPMFGSRKTSSPKP